MTLWQIMKASFEKKKRAKAEEQKRENPLDTELPFGLHLDGKIEISPFLPQGLSTAFPQGAYVIDDFSKTKILGQIIFRIILMPESGDTQSYLWIIQGETGCQVRWFVKLDEVFPASPEEWDFWLAEGSGLIGLSSFQAKGGSLFGRLWGQEGVEHIVPVSYRERILLDRYDAEQALDFEHQTMLYGRKVEDDVCPCDEYLLLSAIHTHDESHVSLDVGVDLDMKTDIKVIY